MSSCRMIQNSIGTSASCSTKLGMFINTIEMEIGRRPADTKTNTLLELRSKFEWTNLCFKSF